MATLTLGTAGNYTWYLDYTLTQSVPNNTSKVDYTLRIRRNVSAANGAFWGTPARDFGVAIGSFSEIESFANIDFRNAQDINFTSGSVVFSHAEDGTLAPKAVTGSNSGASVSAGFPVPTSVGSPTISFPTIPRAATSIARSGSTETGSASTLTISPLVSSFYYVLQYKSPLTTTWTTIGPAGGIVGSSWPYSHTVPHAEIPNATSGTIQFQVTTKQTSGGTQVGSPVSASFTYTVPSTVLPAVGVPTWAEGAATTGLSTLTNSGAVFAQGWSRLKPTFTSSPGTGATLSSAVATVNGHSGSVSSAGTFATPITTQGSSATFSVKATDSRGRTDTETGTVPNVHRWAAPTANAGTPVITPTSTTQTIALSDLSATTTSFYLSAAQRNVLETRTGYRDMTTAGAWIYGAWEVRATSSSDATDNAYAPGTALTVATGLDPTHEYQVTLQVRDIFGKNAVNYSNGLPYVESVLAVPAQGVLVAYDGNTRVGIRKIPTLGALDVGGDIYQNGNLVVDTARTASATQQGIVELATDAEVTTGTDTARAVTPAGLVTGLARSGGMRYVQTVTFTASGTFTKADYPWLRGVRVRVQAAGGAGGGAPSNPANQHSSGGGGGGGGYAEKFLQASALAASETVTIGAAGAPGAAGAGGGNAANSSFGNHAVATGGLGGGIAATSGLMIGALGGNGGEGTTGDLLVDGQSGGMGSGYATLGHGGLGGSAVLGGGGRGAYTGAGSGTAQGAPGGQYGGGGGGSSSNSGGAAIAGSAGGPGIILVDLYA